MTAASLHARLGQLDLEPDFRPVVGARVQATGPARTYDRLQGRPVAGEALCAHGGIDMLTIMGSTPTGQRVASAAAPKMKPSSLECGDKKPILVADAMPDATAIFREVVGETYANTGQLCVARSKIILPRARRAPFVDALQNEPPSVLTGDPMNAATKHGPPAQAGHALAVNRSIAQTVAGGARLPRDGRGAQSGGMQCSATLLQAEPPQAGVLAHECFGPVLTLYVCDQREQAIEAANAGGRVRVATAQTRDLGRDRSLMHRLRAGHFVARAASGIDEGTQMALPVESTGRSSCGVEFDARALESCSRRQAVQ